MIKTIEIRKRMGNQVNTFRFQLEKHIYLDREEHIVYFCGCNVSKSTTVVFDVEGTLPTMAHRHIYPDTPSSHRSGTRIRHHMGTR